MANRKKRQERVIGEIEVRFQPVDRTQHLVHDTTAVLVKIAEDDERVTGFITHDPVSGTFVAYQLIPQRFTERNAAAEAIIGSEISTIPGGDRVRVETVEAGT